MVGEIRGTTRQKFSKEPPLLLGGLPPGVCRCRRLRDAQPKGSSRARAQNKRTSAYNLVRTELPPHRVVCIHVSVPDRSQHVLVAIAPEVLLLDDYIHEVFFGERSGFTTTVTVEYAKERIFQILIVWCRLERHAEHVLHILATALITVTGHPQINPDAERHVNAQQ